MNSETEQTSKSLAVFLDRDGTIIEDRGYLSEPSQVVFFPDTVRSLLRLANHFTLFIATNQSGVEKGFISMDDVKKVNDYIESYLMSNGIRLAATYVCPHERTSGCQCIKPNPFFLRKAERDFGVDLRNSFVIGDHPHDIEFAINVGATGVYVLSGHGKAHETEIATNVFIAEGIHGATEHILQLMQSQTQSLKTK